MSICPHVHQGSLLPAAPTPARTAVTTPRQSTNAIKGGTADEMRVNQNQTVRGQSEFKYASVRVNSSMLQ